MAKRTSPTQRTLAALRKRGDIAAVVERWNSHAMIRQDLFGFIDIVVIRTGQIVGVQATSGPNVASRVEKIKESPFLEPWLRAGAGVEVWGWRKAGPRGKRKLWTPRVVGLQIERADSGDAGVAALIARAAAPLREENERLLQANAALNDELTEALRQLRDVTADHNELLTAVNDLLIAEATNCAGPKFKAAFQRLEELAVKYRGERKGGDGNG